MHLLKSRGLKSVLVDLEEDEIVVENLYSSFPIQYSVIV
jgi:hypothetical protein